MNNDPFNNQFDHMERDLDMLKSHDPSKPHSYDNPLPGYQYIHPIEQSDEDSERIDIS